MLTMTVTEAKNHFDKLIEVAQHEPVTIMGLNKPLVVMTCEEKPTNWFGRAHNFRQNEGLDPKEHSERVKRMVQSVRDERDKWDE